MGSTLMKVLIPLLFIAAAVGAYFLYDQHKVDSTKTEVMKDGRLRIVYPHQNGGFYFDCYITDEGIIQQTGKTQVGGSSGKQGAFFTPAAEGKTDIYTAWLEDPFTKDYQAELFHVTVDSGLRISYKSERITPQEYMTVTGKDLLGLSR